MTKDTKIIYDALTVAACYASNNSSLSDDLALADALGVTRNAILGVKYGYRKCPVRWCPIIEALTKHKIKCETLRPDIAWEVLVQRPRNEEQSESTTPCLKAEACESKP